MIQTKAQTAKQLGITRQAVNNWQNERPLPRFFIEDDDKLKIDTSHPEYQARAKKIISDKKSRAEKKLNPQKKTIQKIEKQEQTEQHERPERPDLTPEEEELARLAYEAELKKKISLAKTAEEK